MLISLLIVKKNNKKCEIREQIKIYFLRVNSVVPRVILGIPVYIATVYLSGTEEPLPWFGAFSVKFLEFKDLDWLKMRFPAWSFYKPCSKIFWFNFWEPMLIQWYENTSAYDTG